MLLIGPLEAQGRRAVAGDAAIATDPRTLSGIGPMLALFDLVAEMLTASIGDADLVAPSLPLANGMHQPLRPVGGRELTALLAAEKPVQAERARPGLRPLPSRRAHPAAELERLFKHSAPRFLLIDLKLCERLGAATLAHLQNMEPATLWVVGWHGPSLQSTALLLACHARGSLCWDDEPARVARALAAMLAGDLWFPRSIMQALYTTLRSSAQHTAGPEGSTPVAPVALTPREIEVARLLRQGQSNKQIAQQLDISVNTVKKHVEHLFVKRGMQRRRQLLV